MREENARELLELIGCEQIADEPSSKGWLNATCPFAPWTHGEGKDSQPSFGVLVTEGDGPSAYSCLACGRKGKGLQGMLWQLKSIGSGVNTVAVNHVRQHERPPRKTGRSIGAAFTRRKEREQALDAFREGDQGSLLGAGGFDVPRPAMDESELDEFIRAYHPYMKARGFTKEACKAWNIMIDHRKYGDMIVFPIRDVEGRLLAYSRRMAWDQPTCTYCGYAGPGQKWGLRQNKSGEGGCPKCGRFVWPKYLHSTGFQRNLYLYGEHMVDREHRKGVVVEGNLDPIKLWQCGIKNAVATLGANPGTGRPDPVKGLPGEQLYRLECLFDEIVLIADGDKAGYQWAAQFEKYFAHRWVGIHVVYAPKGKDPGDMNREAFKRLIGQFDVWM